MKKNAILIGIYALLVFIGGLIGFLTASSYPSLIMGTLFSSLLIVSALKVYREAYTGLLSATILSLLLALFFSYRFFMTFKIMPAGFMFSISLILFLWLLSQAFINKKKS